MLVQHPITPPPELLEHWENQHYEEGENYDVMLIQAYQAGADQELEACCEWLENQPQWMEDLRAARRPQPPSLKEQALAALKRQSTRSVPSLVSTNDCDTILRALEALPE